MTKQARGGDAIEWVSQYIDADLKDYAALIDGVRGLLARVQELEAYQERYLSRANEEISRRQRAEQYALRGDLALASMARKLEAAEARVQELERRSYVEDIGEGRITVSGHTFINESTHRAICERLERKWSVVADRLSGIASADLDAPEDYVNEMIARTERLEREVAELKKNPYSQCGNCKRWIHRDHAHFPCNPDPPVKETPHGEGDRMSRG